jgi:long-subunit acyl-CoA synthetase (AMP-forming)
MRLCPFAEHFFLLAHLSNSSVSLRLGTDFTVVPLGTVTGELRIKGPSVFQEYVGNTKATREEFDEDGRRLPSPPFDT